MLLTRTLTVSILLLISHATVTLAEDSTTFSHASTLDDVPKYAEGFKHFEYVNPDAPKGGMLRLFTVGGFDTLNPFTVKGDPAAGLPERFYEQLMYSPEDDNLSQYGVIAESVEIADDLSFAIYNLRKEAKFHDGSPITSEDVIFSLETLMTKGTPFYRVYFGNVTKSEALGPHSVKFHLGGPPNRELPHILGQIYVFPKKYWEERDFAKTTIHPPLTSGPYKIASLEPGRFVILERIKDYWGEKLPVNVGRNNFDFIRYDYVRDTTVSVEAFKSGEYDYKLENTSKTWATAYDFPGLREGYVHKEEMAHERPAGMQGLVFNTRRDQFKNRNVRKALSYAFDFEWSNKNLFYGQYLRSKSFFSNSDLASTGLPSAEELAILEPYRGKIPDEVFNEIFPVPETDGTGNVRQNLRTAVTILRDEGWRVVNNQLVNPLNNEPVTVEFLLNSPSWERIISPMIRNLKRMGIASEIRTVEPAQYQNRIRDFDFDIVVVAYGQSRSPGNEQRNYWSSESAISPGSRNYAGITDPAVDELVERVISAQSRKDLIAASRALDRVLLWNHYLVPGWHANSDRVIWWDKFGRPDIKPKYNVGLSTWWVDPDKSKHVKNFRQFE